MNTKQVQLTALVGLFFSFLFFVSCGDSSQEETKSGNVELTKELSTDITLEPANTTFKWIGTKIGGEHYGNISLGAGKLKIENGDLSAASFEIDMSSITVTDIEDEEENGYLKGHLLNPDFFNVDTFPTASLVMTSIEDGNFKGDLTIKDITNPVSFPIALTTDDTKVSMSGTMTVDRSLYDIRYASTSFFDDLGDKVIHDEFTIDFELNAAISAE